MASSSLIAPPRRAIINSNEANESCELVAIPPVPPVRIWANGYYIDMTLRDKFNAMNYLWSDVDELPSTAILEEDDESTIEFDFELFPGEECGSTKAEENDEQPGADKEGDEEGEEEEEDVPTASALVIRNKWGLVDPKKGLKGIKPSKDTLAIFYEPNAGGKSINSEALSMEMMGTLWGAREVVTEMEVEYWNESWTKCDYLCSMPCGHDGERELVAVSVTRGMWYPHPSGFNKEEAKRLLKKKLQGLIVARQGIMGKSFRKSILHVWCETEAIADEIQLVYETLLSKSLKGDVLLLLSIAENAPYVFYDYEDTTYIRQDKSISEPLRQRIIKRKKQKKKELYIRVERSLSV